MRLIFLVIISIFTFSKSTIAQETSQILDNAPQISITHWLENAPSDQTLEGKTIVIDFWATWCGPCIQAVPHFNELKEHFDSQEDIVFISISDETPQKIKPTLKRIDFKSVVATDSTGKTQKSFNVTELPETFILNSSGNIAWNGHPEDLNIEMIQRAIDNKPIPMAKKEDATSTSAEEEEDEIDVAYAIKMFKDKSIENAFEIKTTSSEEGLSMGKWPLGYLSSSITMTNLLANVLDVPSTKVIVPKKWEKQYYSVVYINRSAKHEKESKAALKEKLLDHFSCHVSQEKRKVTTWEVSVKDDSKLVPSKEMFSSMSDAGDKFILTNLTIEELLQNLEEKFTISLKTNDRSDKRYDFIIEIANEDALAKSLESYGLAYKASKKQSDYFIINPK